jgi:hypothetical protein
MPGLFTDDPVSLCRARNLKRRLRSRLSRGAILHGQPEPQTSTATSAPARRRGTAYLACMWLATTHARWFRAAYGLGWSDCLAEVRFSLPGWDYP